MTDADLIPDYTGEDAEILYAKVPEEYAGRRFDTVLFELFPEYVLSRSMARKLIDSGDALADGKAGKPGGAVKAGQTIRITVREPEITDAAPENIPLDVIYEDSDIIVVNKPRGMVVHPAAGNLSGTLVNALLYHCGDLSGIGGTVRPGIVHRIDKDTTGLLAVAKNDRAHLALAEEIKDRTMHRIYMAVAEGILSPAEGIIDAPIGRCTSDRKKMAVTPSGRPSVTRYKLLACNERLRLSLAGLSLDTGRTHQIRVHLKSIGHPVTGDPVYGIRNARGMSGQALHAGILLLRHPVSGKEMRFDCPPPDDMEQLIVKNGLKPGEEIFWQCDW